MCDLFQVSRHLKFGQYLIIYQVYCPKDLTVFVPLFQTDLENTGNDPIIK